MSLRGSVAIVGIGETAVGSLPDCGSTEICAEAARLALADAGLTKNQVDGLVTCNPWVETHLYHAEMFSEYMQIFPKFCMTLNAGGATSLAAVQRAASAIVTGVCETVLVTHGDNARTGLTPQEVGAKMTTTMNPQFELPYGSSRCCAIARRTTLTLGPQWKSYSSRAATTFSSLISS